MTPRRIPREALLVTVLIAAGIALRVTAASGDLWLEEIGSLLFARQLQWPWEILSSTHHNDNHPLNTLWLFSVANIAGPHASAIWFRLVAIVCGSAIIPLIYWSERRGGGPRHSAALAAALSAVSFVGVVYSSEARGYAPAAFFSVAAFAWVRHARRDTFPGRAAFAVLCTLGILSHLTFAFVYAGLVAWTFHDRVLRGTRDWRGWIALHLLPVAALAGVYAIDASSMTYSAGPQFHVSEVIARTLSLLAGGPESGSWRAPIAFDAVVVMCAGAIVVARSNRGEAVFFGTALLLAPALVLTASHVNRLDVRYFFVLFPFAWMLLARALSSFSERGNVAVLGCAALVAITTAGQVYRLGPLLQHGRGQYRDAVMTMAQRTAMRTVTVGSDNDSSTEVVIGYYAETVGSDQSFKYVESGAARAGAPEWFVTHSVGALAPGAARETFGSNGQRYVREECFPYGGISGYNWCLYRRGDIRVRPSILSEITLARR